MSSWVTIKEAEARRSAAEVQAKLLAKRIKDLEDEMMMSTEARQAAMTRLKEEEEARVAAEVKLHTSKRARTHLVPSPLGSSPPGSALLASAPLTSLSRLPARAIHHHPS